MIDITTLSPAELSAVKKNARLYLGDRSADGDQDITEDITKSITEISEKTDFRAVFRIFDLSLNENTVCIEELDLSIPSQNLFRLFKDCSRVCVIASTLGVDLDRFMARISSMDMSHAVVVDATASALIEILTDRFEMEHLTGPRTFRFAPGYGDVDLAVNGPLMRGIGADKQIGLSLTPSGLFLPQKSMLGLVGLPD